MQTFILNNASRHKGLQLLIMMFHFIMFDDFSTTIIAMSCARLVASAFFSNVSDACFAPSVLLSIHHLRNRHVHFRHLVLGLRIDLLVLGNVFMF